ncbi:M23/M37 peptidase domain protein [Treponema primitia ZAS-2]|uniref:M23/M37 peptidase domain protein n=1 Tax=Treponema primitia (strain ATCC BAA-887 / DSM 12427 / ZAS-2) TaxID=545694 RepID=F5YHS3_TREPZ|nr:M23 family metallopeptidase [Treponema primitia]AEF85807.1 M23/M37 peptidase domain protein [Treponema primitia ZAS-2]
MKALRWFGKNPLPGLPVLLLLLMAGFAGCSTASKETATISEPSSDPAAETGDSGEEAQDLSPVQEKPPFLRRIALIPGEVHPGEPLTVAYVPPTPRANEPLPDQAPLAIGTLPPGDDEPPPAAASAPHYRAVLRNAQGQRLTRAEFFPLEGTGPVLIAILAVPSTAAPGIASILVEESSAALEEIPITIADREFAAEIIDLDQRNTSIRTEPDPQKTLESDQLWAIINSTGGEIFSESTFAPPVSSTRRTSFYGDRRVYRYVTGKTDTAIHAGVDYGVPTGTPVSACADGRVVLARFRISTGNSVILEHLPGVYSIYYHMDSIAVAEGAMVKSGELLGESGFTGLATGPHLHWEIRVSGENADPDAFTLRPVLDKQAILSKLEESENP